MTLPSRPADAPWLAAARDIESRATAFSDPADASRTAALLRERGARAGRRDCPEHVTASCIVFSPDLRSVLLTLHKKAGRWLQFGGHVESDDGSPAATALREAREESGHSGLDLLSLAPVDVSVHALPGAFGACRIHDDLVFAAVLDPHADVQASPESASIGWHRLDALPDLIAPDLPPRLPAWADAARRLAGLG